MSDNAQTDWVEESAVLADFETAALAAVSDEELDTADEDGCLGGNQEYLDLRFLTLEHLASALALECGLVLELQSARDPSASEAKFLAARPLDDEAAALWNLDIGVASVTVALIVAGAHPFLSCNGGVFGTRHGRSVPMVRFYLRDLDPGLLLDWAQKSEATVTLEDGVVVLGARDISPLLRFAALVFDTLSGNTAAQ